MTAFELTADERFLRLFPDDWSTRPKLDYDSLDRGAAECVKLYQDGWQSVHRVELLRSDLCLGELPPDYLKYYLPGVLLAICENGYDPHANPGSYDLMTSLARLGFSAVHRFWTECNSEQRALVADWFEAVLASTHDEDIEQLYGEVRAL